MAMAHIWILVKLLSTVWVGVNSGSVQANMLYAPQPHVTPAVGCDKTTEMGPNEALSIYTFPPKIHSTTQVYGAFTSRECTWTFRAVGNCTLELITTGYERGDVDCTRQYFLLGDENTEQRVCGFSRPPALIASTGRELFLTHFQRSNGGYETGCSVLSGTVHCREWVTPAPCSCKQIQSPRTSVNRNCPELGDCTLNGTAKIGNTTNMISTSLTSPTNATLWLLIKIYSAVLPLHQTCRAPLPAIPPQAGNCDTTQMACPPTDPTGCSFDVELFAQSQPVFGTILSCSPFLPDTQCTHQIQICVRTAPF